MNTTQKRREQTNKVAVILPTTGLTEPNQFEFSSDEKVIETIRIPDEGDGEVEDSISLKMLNRVVTSSLINRSCFHIANYFNQRLVEVPLQLQRSISGFMKLSQIQKLDLSSNKLIDIQCIGWRSMTYLKEINVANNQIKELPSQGLNSCKNLRIINAKINTIQALPYLENVVVIKLTLNPLQLITSSLLHMRSLSSLSFDWLNYLIDLEPKMNNSAKYQRFKQTILTKLDIEQQSNHPFYDFKSFFTVRNLQNASKLGLSPQQSQEHLICPLLYRAISKSDNYFIKYLRQHHANTDFSSMQVDGRLLLADAFEKDNRLALDLFKLRKDNYSQVTDQVYLQSVILASGFNNIQMLKHLLNTPSKKRIAQDETNFIMVINNMLANFDDRKETGKMLVYFIEECWDCSMGKVIVYLPIVYNWRLFQNLSKALLFVLQNDILRKKIVVRPEPPMSDGMLHFAMRSKSEALLLLTLRSGADVFEKNQFGVNCKFCCGTTIVCRKLVWLYQKKAIPLIFQRNTFSCVGQIKEHSHNIDSSPTYEQTQNFSEQMSQQRIQVANHNSLLKNLHNSLKHPQNTRFSIVEAEKQLTRLWSQRKSINHDFARKELNRLYTEAITSNQILAFEILNMIDCLDNQREPTLTKKLNEDVRSRFGDNVSSIASGWCGTVCCENESFRNNA